MAKEDAIPDANRLYIGEGVSIKGDVAVPDTLMVYGVIEGDVSAGTLWVGETGIIRGKVTVAENAEVSGKVSEKLDVKCLLVLRSTGRIDAKVSCGMLQIEQGASITGGITSTEYRPALAKSEARSDARSEALSRPDQRLGLTGNGASGARRAEIPGLDAVSLALSPRTQ
jgi:cytoskeletal protein CcmA (bactofilin family)